MANKHPVNARRLSQSYSFAEVQSLKLILETALSTNPQMLNRAPGFRGAAKKINTLHARMEARIQKLDAAERAEAPAVEKAGRYALDLVYADRRTYGIATGTAAECEALSARLVRHIPRIMRLNVVELPEDMDVDGAVVERVRIKLEELEQNKMDIPLTEMQRERLWLGVVTGER